MTRYAQIKISAADRRALRRAAAICRRLADQVDALAGDDSHPARDDAAGAWARLSQLADDGAVAVDLPAHA